MAENLSITAGHTGSTPGSRNSKLITAVLAARDEADTGARTERLALNQRNWDCYRSRQDFSEKVAGQSCEFLPKTSVAVDKWSAKVRQALVSGDFVKLRFKPGREAANLLPEADATAWLRYALENLDGPEGHIATLAGDVLKLGGLEGSCAIKVCDGRVRIPLGPMPEKGKKRDFWRLKLELVPFANLWRDPTGANSYVAHRYELDAHEVRRRAADGIYDKGAVAKLSPQRLPVEQDKPDEQRAEDGARQAAQAGRRGVIIHEHWGLVLDGATGDILHEGLVIVGNDKHVLYKGENPYWHGRLPFVFLEPRRIPASTKHRALFDDACALNLCLNELYNLLTDGGIASVYGISQLRRDYLEDPDQVTDGIAQGTCLVVSQSLPPGEKVYEQVTSGKVPGEAMAMLETLKADLADACFSGDVGVQSLDNEQITATALALRQQQDSSFTGDIVWTLATTAIEPVCRLAFQLMIQRVAEYNTAELIDVLGPENALRLGSMAVRAPAQLFDAFEGAADITIEGLRLLAERGRDFSRMINFAQTAQLAGVPLPMYLQSVGIDPVAFIRKLAELAGLDLLQFRMQPQGGQPGMPMGGPEQQGQPQIMGAAGQVMPGVVQPGAEVPAMASAPNQALRVVGRSNQAALAGM